MRKINGKIIIRRDNFQRNSDKDASRLLKTNLNANIISKRVFQSVGAAYINDHSKNELVHILLTGETRYKQGSKDARV